MKTANEGQTRRSFLAAVGVGAAVLAVPAGAVAASGSGPAAHLPALRAWYQRELERFTEDVKPELVAGTMGRALERRGMPSASDCAPMNRLQEAIDARFGLGTTEREDKCGTWISGDEQTAHLILAVSPSADDPALGLGDGGWDHVAVWARESVVEDVLQEAARRGWIERAE